MNSSATSAFVKNLRNTFLAGLVLAGCGTAHAGNATWNGGTSTAWSNSLNWTGGTPGNLSGGGTLTTDMATFSSNPANGTTSALVVDAGRTIGSLDFTGGAGNFVIGTGTLALSSGGTTQIDNGLSSTNATETISVPLVIAGAGATYTFQNNSLNGTGAGAGTLDLGAIKGGTAGATAITLAGSNTNANTISGIISTGTATSVSVSKSGAGNWTLSGANTYTGGTTITSGTLVGLNTTVGTTSVTVTTLGTGAVNSNGGTLLLGNNVATGSTFVYAENFSINGGTVEANLGTVGLGAKTGGNTVTIGSGGAILGSMNNGNFSGAANRQALLLYASVSGSGPITVEYLGNNTTSPTATDAAGSLVRFVSATNAYSGTITIVGGANNPNGAGTGLGGTYALIDGGGSTLANAIINLQGDNVSGGTFSSYIGNSTFGVLTGTGIARVAGLMGDGDIVLNNVGGAGGSYILDVGNSTTNLSTTYSGSLSNVGGLTKDGSGTLTLTGANSFTGGVIINSGAIQLGTGGTTGRLPGAGNLVDNGNLIVNRSDNVSQSGASIFTSVGISGTGALTMMGTGTLILTATNTYTGALNLNAGTVVAATANINGTDTTNGIVFNGGELQSATGTITTAKAIIMQGAGTFDSNGTRSTFSGNITGSGGALTKAGTGTLVLGGSASTFSGGLIVSNGTVQDNNANSGVLGSGNVTFGSSNTPTLDLNGNNATTGLLIGSSTNGVVTNSLTASTSTLTLAGSGSQSFGGVIQDGAIGKSVALGLNSGTQTLTNANSYSGGTKITGGTLYANNTGTVTSATGTGAISVSSGGTLAGKGTITPGSGNGIKLASGSTLKSGITETGNAVTGRMTLNNGAAATTILDASLGNVTLAFNLGSGNDGLLGVGHDTPNASPYDFSNPNIDSSYLTVNGTKAGEIAFNGSNTADIVQITDLTGGALQLSLGTPYLLMTAYDDAAYVGLVTSGGSVGTVPNDGYVENVNVSVIVNGVPDSTTYPAARLFLDHGKLMVVPEPGTWALTIGGLALLVLIQRRRAGTPAASKRHRQ